MSALANDALHDIHTATNDVLKGYRELSARAEPDILAVIRRLTELHERHAGEQVAELTRLRDSPEGDSSIQGTVNKLVVVLRDWLSGLDRDVLAAVRDGEEALRDKYIEALAEESDSGGGRVAALLKVQMQAINLEIARLPRA